MAGLIDIATACSNGGSSSVIGVVVDKMDIFRTRGSSACITFELKDEDLDGYAWEQCLKVKYFNDNESCIPHVMLNDVVLLRGVRVSQYQGRPFGVASQGQRVPWAIFRADEDPSKSPSITAGPVTFDPTPTEKAKASALLERVQHKIQPQTPQRTRRGTVPQQSTTVVEASLVATPTPRKGKMPVSLVKDAEPDKFCIIVAQVVKDHHYENDRSTIWVTDYTSNEGLPNHEKDDSMTGTDGDPYGHLSSKNKSWPGPWGKLTMQVTLWNPHASFARSNVIVGSIVLLSYVRPKISRNGNLEAAIHEDKKYPDKIHLKVVSPEYDVHAKELMKRRKEYWKIHGDQKDGRKDDREDEPKPAKKQKVDEPKKTPRKEGNRTSLPVAAVATSSRVKPNPQVKPRGVGIPTRSLDSILAAETHITKLPGGLSYKVPFQNVGYSLLARVVDFYPQKLEDFAVKVPSKSILDDDTESMVWEWRFCLLVEGIEPLMSKNQQRQQLKLFVAGSEAEFLLCLDATDLRRDPHRLSELREKLFILWGDLEEQKQAVAGNPVDDKDWKPVKSSSLPFMCCIKEYGVSCRHAQDPDAMAIDGQLCAKEECFGWERRFSLYGTTIHE
ncbi:Telomere end binding protein [Penicillium herquei]|nr:Telomere end binding protein [Penicillium herquei]